MAGQRQFDYCLNIKKRFPDYFRHKVILDVGSMDINGNNRFLFEECSYMGLDLGHGNNVDEICPIHEYNPGFQFDTIISTEMLEHDRHYKESLKAIFKLLKDNGLLIITAATEGRKEYGTYRTDRKSSPFTLNYYKNVTKKMISETLDFDKFIKLELDIVNTDIFFWGIKNEN